MCLVKMRVDREEESPPPSRRIVLARPVSQHSHRSSRIIMASGPTATSIPVPKTAQYIVVPSSSRDPGRATRRTSVPRIIHAAPSPPRTPRIEMYVSGASKHSSPHGSRASIHSRTSHHSSRHSSAAGGYHGRRSSEIVYVERQRSTRGERERERDGRRSSTYLTANIPGGEEIRHVSADPARTSQTFYLDNAPARTRSRSITYATTGVRSSRERVVVEDGGRRMESYRVLGTT